MCVYNSKNTFSNLIFEFPPQLKRQIFSVNFSKMWHFRIIISDQNFVDENLRLFSESVTGEKSFFEKSFPTRLICHIFPINQQPVCDLNFHEQTSKVRCNDSRGKCISWIETKSGVFHWPGASWQLWEFPNWTVRPARSKDMKNLAILILIRSWDFGYVDDFVVDLSAFRQRKAKPVSKVLKLGVWACHSTSRSFPTNS